MTKNQIMQAVEDVLPVVWVDDVDQARTSINQVNLCVYGESVSLIAGQKRSMFQIWGMEDLRSFQKELAWWVFRYGPAPVVTNVGA